VARRHLPGRRRLLGGQQLRSRDAAHNSLAKRQGRSLARGVGGNIDPLRPPLERRRAELTPLGPRVAAGQLGQDAIVLGAVAGALDTARDLVFEQRAVRIAATG
jgi:hypothetical protein